MPGADKSVPSAQEQLALNEKIVSIEGRDSENTDVRPGWGSRPRGENAGQRKVEETGRLQAPPSSVTLDGLRDAGGGQTIESSGAMLPWPDGG
jgi:hypothetical protein